MDAFPFPPRSFSGSARKVPLISAFDWISQGWQGFIAAPRQWLVLGAALFLFWATVDWLSLYALSAAQLPGPLGTALAYVLVLGPMVVLPLVTAGGLQACRKLGRGQVPDLADLFWGFGNKRQELFVVGLLYLAGWLCLFAFGTLVKGPLAIFLPTLAGFAFLMAIWFLPALVSFHGVSPLVAVRTSFLACSRNLGAFVIFGFVMMILHFLAVLPMGLGLLLLLPVVVGSMHASFRDIFPES
jgi:uncharacterized membrane protein